MILFAVGADVGAAVALAIAPAKGRDTRAYLGRRGREVARTVTAQADRVTAAVKSGREQATAMRKALDRAYHAVKAQLPRSDADAKPRSAMLVKS